MGSFVRDATCGCQRRWKLPDRQIGLRPQQPYGRLVLRVVLSAKPRGEALQASR
jgi:hypothetical protein